MNFIDAIKICLVKYLDFSGRAARPEYWWFVLLSIVLSFIPVIGWIIRLVLILPSLSVQVRRLHDLNRSAWWLLLLVPPITIVGGIVLLIMSAFPGTPGPNRYGPSPLQWQQDFGGPGQPPPEHPYAPPSSPYGSYDDQTFETGTAEIPPAAEPGARQFCTQCGMQLQEDAQFCSVCGTAV